MSIQTMLDAREKTSEETQHNKRLQSLGENDLSCYQLTDLDFMFGCNKQKVCKAHSVGDLRLLYDAGVRFAISVVVGNSTEILCLSYTVCHSFLLLLFGTARCHEFKLTYYRNPENDQDYAFVVAH